MTSPSPPGDGKTELDHSGEVSLMLAQHESLRTIRLARVNALLQASAEKLGALEDVNHYIADLMSVGAEFLGADSASYWSKHEDAQDPSMRLELGAAHPPPPLEYQSHNPRTYDDAAGQRRMLALPMITAGEHVGALAMHFRDEIDLSPEDHELARAFANHAAIAVYMSRVVQVARESALAEEREAAAMRRLEFVTRLAGARRDALQRLAENPQAEGFLGHVLAVSMEQFDAVAGSVWLLEAGSARRILAIENGELHTVQSDWTPPIDQMLGSDIAVFAREDLIQVSTRYFERISAGGAQSVATIPMVFGNEKRGFIALRLRHDRGLTDEEREISLSLANQAVLALELTRLGDSARTGAVTAERNRLAREMHDTLAQGFAAIRLQLGLALGELPADGPAVEAIRLAQRIAGENLVEARRSVAILRSPTPALKDGLSGVVDGVRRLGARNLDLTIEPTLNPPPDVAHALMRIAQEALMNAVNHAEATRIGVRLASPSEGLLRLSIVDNGRGFAPEAASSGFGLAGMRERAMIIGADFTLVSEPGAGTEVIVTWLTPEREP